MTKTEKATQWMIQLAQDDSHGYDQEHRWGPDYDCSSAVITAWQTAGVPVKQQGASDTEDMYGVFLECGFSNVTAHVDCSDAGGMLLGDVLLRPGSHVAMYIGGHQLVHASLNELGTTTGGKTGDQTGKEICVRSYYNKPWTYVLRFTAEGGGGGGTSNEIVRQGQIYANKFANTGIATDGERGPATTTAGIKVLQTALNHDYGAGLRVDGAWGSASSRALGNHYVTEGESQYMVTAAEILLMLNAIDSHGVEMPGKFGSGLKAAVISFQQRHGLTANGICNRATFLALIGE